MIVVSHFFINNLLQRGVLRGAETQNRFNLKNASGVFHNA
jgi:hypothetical protein